MMRRRDFIPLLGGSAVTWPLAAQAQQPVRLPTIGFLIPTTPSTESQRLAAFTQRLKELGWIEGRTIAIEYRWAEGLTERFDDIAAELVKLKVDIIVTSATAPVIAAKRATSVIPIVFALAGDPVRSGLIASLARPGGNVTGLSLQQPDLAAKRLELLREIVPHLRRLAMLINIGNPSLLPEIGEVQAAARKLGMEVNPFEIRRVEDIAAGFKGLTDGLQALYVVGDPLLNNNRIRINTLALGARLPSIYPSRENVEP